MDESRRGSRGSHRRGSDAGAGGAHQSVADPGRGRGVNNWPSSAYIGQVPSAQPAFQGAVGWGITPLTRRPHSYPYTTHDQITMSETNMKKRKKKNHCKEMITLITIAKLFRLVGINQIFVTLTTFVSHINQKN